MKQRACPVAGARANNEQRPMECSGPRSAGGEHPWSQLCFIKRQRSRESQRTLTGVPPQSCPRRSQDFWTVAQRAKCSVQRTTSGRRGRTSAASAWYAVRVWEKVSLLPRFCLTATCRHSTRAILSLAPPPLLSPHHLSPASQGSRQGRQGYI